MSHLSLTQRASRPFLVLGILHQDFGAYAGQLAAEDKAEWEKIRGRFEDIAFEEPAEEILRLIAEALSAATADCSLGPKSKVLTDLCTKAWKLKLAPGTVTQAEFRRLLKRCYPLHPLAALMLGRVFRRTAQNERSVFSFLFSSEPFGLREFVTNGHPAAGFYGVDRLYDYLTHNVRDSIYASAQAKKWAESESVLDSLPDASSTEAFLIKTVGLLNAVGQTDSLRASRPLLEFAGTGAAKQPITAQVIRGLVRRSALVHRRYNDTYALWEGSDVDLEAAIRAARDQVDPSLNPAELAANVLDLRPIVARRHSFRTGTLRYFRTRFRPVSDLQADSEQTWGDCEIAIILPRNAAEERKALQLARATFFEDRGDLLICIPSERADLLRAIRDLVVLRSVQDNTPELEGDRTARRELAVQVEGAQRRATDQLHRLLMSPAGLASHCYWFCGGEKIRANARIGLQEYLSEICDELYERSPRIHNELVNRRELSSAAAAARRNLIERMIDFPGLDGLGIEGTPPEKSMYRSLLAVPGIHRRMKGNWEFRNPKPSADQGICSVWKAIQDFFMETEHGAKPVSELFARLSAPPFGVVAGPLPILLCAALLAYDSEIAFYRDGSFVPHLNVPDFELLMKHPDRYTVRRLQVSGVRLSLFHQLVELLGQEYSGSHIGKPQILEVVRPLLRFVRDLDEYTKRTAEVSIRAAAIREVLLSARQPDDLLFVDLPKACGVGPFQAKGRKRASQIQDFSKRLRSGLTELQQSYQRLLDDILSLIRATFAVEGPLREVRVNLASRATPLESCKGDPILRAFVSRVVTEGPDDWQWLELLAGCLANRLPKVWRDDDIEQFEQSLLRVARLFSRMESLVFHAATNQDGALSKQDEAIRIGVTTSDASEWEKVVRIPRRRQKAVDNLEQLVESALDNSGKKNPNDLVLAALARVIQRRID